VSKPLVLTEDYRAVEARPLVEQLRSIERDAMTIVLHRYKTVRAAAAALSMHPSSLASKLARLGIQP
jgi:transcriptional regulator with GAF, ATPase, and Fis domain